MNEKSTRFHERKINFFSKEFFLTIFYIFIYLLFLFDPVVYIQKCNAKNTDHNAVLIASCYWFDRVMEKHGETGLIVTSLFVERDRYYKIFS